MMIREISIVFCMFLLTNAFKVPVFNLSKDAEFVVRDIVRGVPLKPSASASQVEDALLDVPDLIRKYGYPAEVHEVITEDGYILGVHRIPRGRNETKDPNVVKPVILLQHGLLASSADYIVAGPGKALAYLLADAGFDVWMGNARGNTYSRAHLTRDPDIIFSFFWDFSWHEIGKYDLAAVVDHILDTSEQQYLHFVGHSQGSTSFFVLNSLRPEYNGMFLSAHLMAPVAYMEHFPTKALGELASYTNFLYSLGSVIGMQELFPRSSLAWYDDGEYRCNENFMYTFFCENLIPAYNQIKNPVVHGHFPSGSSLRQFAHYGQISDAQRFQLWDFGSLRNILLYGTSSPPIYDLTKVTVDIVLIYSDGDVLVGEQDVLNASKDLPRARKIKVAVPEFNHYDFCWSDSAKRLVYDYILDNLKKNRK